MLLEPGRRAGLDDLPAQTRREADPFPLNIGSGVAKDPQDLRVVAELHADLLENGVGVALDEAEALLGENVEGRDSAPDVRHTLPCLACALGPAGVASTAAAPAPGGPFGSRCLA
jgi:hypothetical protein